MVAVSGLKIDSRIVSFKFTPSVGIVASRIDKLGLDIRSFQVPLTRSVRQVMIPSFRQNFISGGRPTWDDLEEETIKRKGSDTKLVRTGALRKVMGQINIWSIGPKTATIRDLPAKVSYGIVHQAGHQGSGGDFASFARRVLDMGPTEKLSKVDVMDALKIQAINDSKGIAPKGASATIPARPFVVMQPEDEDDIHEVFGDWLDERIAGTVLRI